MLCGMAGFAAAFYSWRFRNFTVLCLFLLAALGGAVMGCRELRAQRAIQVLDQVVDQRPKLVTGSVALITDLPDDDQAYLVLRDVTITSGTRNVKLPGRMQATVSDKFVRGGPGALPVAGEKVSFPARITRPVFLSNFFGYNREEALRNSEIFSAAVALKLPKSVQVTTHDAGLAAAVTRHLTAIRKQLSQNLRRDMWAREGRLMVAMIFNDLRGMTDEERRVFRDSGTLHLFAVSGMHVAILGLGLHLVFRSLRLGIRAAWVGVAVTLLFYLWIIDFVPSATRSYLMLVALTAGQVLRREVDPYTSLILAVAVILAVDPSSLWAPGFILSVMGVVGIIFYTPLMRLWFLPHDLDRSRPSVRMMTHAADVLFSTVAVAIVLFPVQVYYFGFWNGLSPVANLLQAFLATFVLSGGVLVAFAGLLPGEVSNVLGHSASAIMHLIYRISELTAQAHWALFYFRALPVWMPLLVYAVLCAGYYLVFRDTPEFRLKSRARFAVHSMGCIGAIVLYQVLQSAGANHLRVWALDVGQGDATVLQCPNGQTILVDGGRSSPNMGATVVVPQLRSLGIKMLDYVVATHDDDDHTGGLAEVIRLVGARHLLLPKDFQAKSRSSMEMINAAKTHGCIISEVHDGYEARAGECRLTVLNPVSNRDSDQSDNDSSIVLSVTYGRFSALLMGDAGAAVEGRLINEVQDKIRRPLSLLKLGHHGSRTASTEEFISFTRPRWALVSCSARNNFGHPARAVVERVHRNGVRLLRTDREGAVQITTNGQTICVKKCRPDNNAG